MEITYKLSGIEQVAQEILSTLKFKTVLLNAEMGSGKTTLIKAILQVLGIEDFEGSPTFSLVNEYATSAATIYHFDLYRINEAEELYDIGFEDYLDKNAYIFIEWPEHAQGFLEDDYHTISIKTLDNETRTLTMV